MIVRYILIIFLFVTILDAKSCNTFSDTSLQTALENNKLSGYIDIKDDGKKRLDFHKDLGLSKIKNSISALLKKGYSKHSVSFKLNHYKYQGTSKLTDDIVKNSAFNATSTMVKNELDLKWAKASYRYHYTKNLSIGADFHGLRLYTLVNGTSYRKILFLPAVGVDYSFDVEDDFRVITKTSGTITPNNRYFSQYMGFSFDLGLSHCTSLNIGYQYKNLYLNTDKYKSDLKFSGLYAGIAVKF